MDGGDRTFMSSLFEKCWICSDSVEDTDWEEGFPIGLDSCIEKETVRFVVDEGEGVGGGKVGYG